MVRKFYLCLSIALPVTLFCGKSSANDLSSHADTGKSAFTFIDIAGAANRGFYDEVSGDSVGGWADFGHSACLRRIRPGIQTFDDGLVPFNIIDPNENNDKSVVVLSGPDREKLFPQKSAEIKVNCKFSELYFLHTAMYAKTSKKALPLVKYLIYYRDGSESVFVCKKAEQIDDWWDPPKDMPHALRAYNEGNLWLINTPWKNPHPEKQIEWIRAESTGNAIPILVGITGSNSSAVYDSFMSRINEMVRRYNGSGLKIALIQTAPDVNQRVNLEKGERFCRQAKAMDADIAVFPEMYSDGYYMPVDFDDPCAVEEWENMAVTKDGPFITHFQKLAKELQMAIVITYLQNRQGRLLNSATLFDRHGKEVITYSKVHTLDFFKMEASLTPGDDFYVDELDTRFGPVKTGIMICYDREFPESARILMLKGAELILTPNACGLHSLRINEFQTRAWENSVITAMANYTGKQGYNGHSCAFDADGKKIMTAGEDEGVFIAEVNIFKTRDIRQNTYWGNSFRRPLKYKKLISTDVERPFIRRNAFGQPFDRLKR